MNHTDLLTQRKGAVELIELLFVTVLLSSIGLAMYFTLLFSQQTNIRVKHYAQASQIAATQVEALRSTAYASITAPYNGTFTNGATATDLPSGSTNLVVSYQNSPTNTIKRVVATVSWQENNKPRNISYTTLIVDQGVSQ
jgi:hypothetical protein